MSDLKIGSFLVLIFNLNNNTSMANRLLVLMTIKITLSVERSKIKTHGQHIYKKKCYYI